MTKATASELLEALPAGLATVVERLRKEAERRGAAVYLVGGPVRDWLLDRPLRDVDLLVDPGAEAEAVARAAAPADAGVTVHERFGTVKLAIGDLEIDLAGARREVYARPGSLPTVEPGDLEEDLRRRDFSVNALAVRLRPPGEDVEVIDWVEGQSDLKERRLRILHPRSFHDDPTRALRAARLAPRLGFSLTRGSRNALRDAIRDGAFGSVSGDRVRREFERLFADAELSLAPLEALRLLGDWHVLPALEPGLALAKEARAPLRRLGRALADPPWRWSRMRPLTAGLATWLASLRPALRRRTLERLAIRGEIATRIARFPRDRAAWERALKQARGRGAVDAALSGIDEERLLALYVGCDPPIRRRIQRWANEDRARRLPVTGRELTELGIAGPEVGRALARIRTAYLDGALANREEALALARELAAGRAPQRGRGGRRGAKGASH
jgi:tRNA nucleotidyltransferase (CCA-adding enzyme)